MKEKLAFNLNPGVFALSELAPLRRGRRADDGAPHLDARHGKAVQVETHQVDPGLKGTRLSTSSKCIPFKVLVSDGSTCTPLQHGFGGAPIKTDRLIGHTTRVNHNTIVYQYPVMYTGLTTIP